MTLERIRILIAKVGLDGHDRGAKVVARYLRDSGMDVVYTGLHHTPEEIIVAAAQEDVDVLGVSILSGAHMSIISHIIELMQAEGLHDMALVAGGVIPDEDVTQLLQMGVAKVFPQDTPLDTLVSDLQNLVAQRRLR